MQITETTHPPAGASALLPSIDTDLQDLGWYYLPVILLSSTLALAVALVLNNIQRRYPLYWIAPEKYVDETEVPGKSTKTSELDVSSEVSIQSPRVDGDVEKSNVHTVQSA